MKLLILTDEQYKQLHSELNAYENYRYNDNSHSGKIFSEVKDEMKEFSINEAEAEAIETILSHAKI